jgi:hypothetical protein
MSSSHQNFSSFCQRASALTDDITAILPLVTMNGYPPPMGAPSTPWRAAKTQDGKEYYHNALTGVTTWEKPDEMKDEVEVSTRRCRCRIR